MVHSQSVITATGKLHPGTFFGCLQICDGTFAFSIEMALMKLFPLTG